MPLKPCPACAHPIADTVRKCPHCGAKIPRTVSRRAVVLTIGGVLAAIVFAARQDPPAPPGPQLTAVEQSALRSSAVTLAAWKNTLKDPSSAQASLVLVTSSGAACMVVRARNSFNAIVPNRLVAPPNLPPVSEEEDPEGFAAAWDDWCAGKSGTDVTQSAARWAKL